MPSVELAASEQKLGGQFLGGNVHARTRALKPLKYTGTLDSFKNQDLTPVVGREYEGLQVRDLLRWGDGMIRDLAVTSKSGALVLAALRGVPRCAPGNGSQVRRWTRLTVLPPPHQSHNAASSSSATKT